MDQRLDEVRPVGGVETEFLYDADGVRVRRSTGSEWVFYFSGGEYERDGGVGVFRHYHSLGGVTVAFTETSGNVGGVTSWLWGDHLGSSSLMRDEGGTRRVQRYGPWGELRTDGNLTTDRAFTGQIADQATGLAFYNARYYDPTVGRFISPDTIIPNPLDGQDYNRYTYVGNNPVTRNDPTGHLDRDIHLDDEARAIRCGWQGERCGHAWRANYLIDLGNTGGRATVAESIAAEVVVTVGAALTGAEWALDAAACADGFGPNWSTVFDCGAAVLPVVNSRWDNAADAASTAVRGGDGLVDDGGRWLDDALECASLRSFSGVTGVLMAHGTSKPIEDVVVGDLVWSPDPEVGVSAARPVLAVWPHLDRLVDLDTTVGAVTTTEDHHFWNVTDHEWQEVQEFETGDELYSADGSFVAVIGLDPLSWTFAAAYDLTIDDFHTYYVAVGDDHALVHNRNCIDLTYFRKDHILNRHRHGSSVPGKTRFPAAWSDDQILEYVSDVATDPQAVTGVGKYNARYAVGVRDGVTIRVDFFPDYLPDFVTPHPRRGLISTAYRIN